MIEQSTCIEQKPYRPKRSRLNGDHKTSSRRFLSTFYVSVMQDTLPMHVTYSSSIRVIIYSLWVVEAGLGNKSNNERGLYPPEGVIFNAAIMPSSIKAAWKTPERHKRPRTAVFSSVTSLHPLFQHRDFHNSWKERTCFVTDHNKHGTRKVLQLGQRA